MSLKPFPYLVEIKDFSKPAKGFQYLKQPDSWITLGGAASGGLMLGHQYAYQDPQADLSAAQQISYTGRNMAVLNNGIFGFTDKPWLAKLGYASDIANLKLQYNNLQHLVGTAGGCRE